MRITGKRLNVEWDVGAKHALYNKVGEWYHILEYFPGALFDADGYVVFRTSDDFWNCGQISIGEHVHVPDGIRKLTGYVRMREPAEQARNDLKPECPSTFHSSV